MSRAPTTICLDLYNPTFAPHTTFDCANTLTVDYRIITTHLGVTMTDHDDLHAEPTEGFKVGEKKTIDEYQQLGTSFPLSLQALDSSPTTFIISNRSYI